MKPMLFISALVIFVYSCKKKDNVIEDPKYISYSALSAGNYWIYEINNIDANGSRTFDSYDSVYISRDTMIRGNVYYIQENMKPWETRVLRDSMHYIVDHFGDRRFSSEDFGSLLDLKYYLLSPEDTFCRMELRMGEKDALTIVPAGSFKTDNVRYTSHLAAKYIVHKPVLTTTAKYAPGIGLVYDEMVLAMSNGEYMEKRLLRYQVK